MFAGAGLLLRWLVPCLDLFLITLTFLEMSIIVAVTFQPISVPSQRKIIVFMAQHSTSLRSAPFNSKMFMLLVFISLTCGTGLGWLRFDATQGLASPATTGLAVRGVTSFFLAGGCLGLQHLLSALAVDGGEAMMMTIQKMDMRRLIDSYQPLSKQALQALLGPYESMFSPEVHGSLATGTAYPLFRQLSRPKGGDRAPLFFVSNHALLGLEMALLIKVLMDRGISVRGLGDFGHWLLPGWRNLLEAMGCVPGSRENVNAMFEAGEDLLVYPGGGAEIMKPASVPRYTLMWKQRTGFAKCAIQNGATIVPMCSVGTEDMLHTVADVPAPLIKKGFSIPVSVPTTPPQRVYFWFGEPIHTDGGTFGNDPSNTAMAEQLRDVTKASVEVGIALMQTRQKADPGRYMSRRIVGSLGVGAAPAAALAAAPAAAQLKAHKAKGRGKPKGRGKGTASKGKKA